MIHPKKQLLFLLLSLADLVLTCWLLSSFSPQFYETNPFAGWWLARHGLAGLVCYKALMVALILLLSLLVARFCYRAAGRVLMVGCAVSAVVVCYSATLCLGAVAVRADDRRLVNAHLDQENRLTQEWKERGEVFWALVGRLGDDVVAGQCTLSEAATCLAASDYIGNRQLQLVLRLLFPDCPLPESLAALILREINLKLKDDSEGYSALAARLEQEFWLTYGSAPPRPRFGPFSSVPSSVREWIIRTDCSIVPGSS